MASEEVGTYFSISFRLQKALKQALQPVVQLCTAFVAESGLTTPAVDLAEAKLSFRGGAGGTLGRL